MIKLHTKILLQVSVVDCMSERSKDYPELQYISR